MSKKRMVILTFIFLIIIVAFFYFFSGWFSATTGLSIGEDQDDALAKCLTSKDTILFTAKKCPQCNRQKSLFGSTAVRSLNIIDCTSLPGQCANLQLLPAWQINGDLLYGVRTTSELRILSGCDSA